MDKFEIKICQNCKQNFIIEADDFNFYEKMKVPPPTWCPECRIQRRMVWRSDRVLYKRKSDWSGEMIFSRFSSSSPVKVYEKDIWWSDKWDPLKFGRNYDFDRPFFEQFAELLREVPIANLAVINMVNSEYCNNFNDAKNCYLIFGGGFAENCMYGYRIFESKDCVDNSFLYKGELCYDTIDVNHGYKVFFSVDCEDSHDIYFSKNLVNCSDCFGCINLRHKNYYIFNQPFSKEEYHQRIKKFDLGSHHFIDDMLTKVQYFWLRYPYKFMHGRHNQNVSGDYIFNSKNVFHSHNIKGGEDLKFCQNADMPPVKDTRDYSFFGKNIERVYESASCGLGTANTKFCDNCWNNVNDLTYCVYCLSSCSDLFGCVGLRNKQYCILNKQYSKAEYERLVPKIIEQMNNMPYVDKKGRVYKYGEFFPPEFSPYSYNETVSQDYFPLTRETALEKGFPWKDSEERHIQITLKSEDLPDNIRDVKDSIVDEIIGCLHQGICNEQCTTAFKIIVPELEFYRKMNIAIPRLCSNCRHHRRLKQRNLLKFYKRKCQCNGSQSQNGVYKNTVKHFHNIESCPNIFETAYSPAQQEIIYCEECYNVEVV